jgi:hypothetical protein
MKKTQTILMNTKFDLKDIIYISSKLTFLKKTSLYNFNTCTLKIMREIEKVAFISKIFKI